MPYVFALFLAFSALEAQDPYNMSLRSVVAPKARVLGIDPDGTPEGIEEELKTNGLYLLRKNLSKDYLLNLDFQGLPKGLWIREGKTSLYFFEGRLYRIELVFEPSYSNFLLLRKQLFRSLGTRFSIKQSQESIDNFLKSHLANLKEGEYSERTEEEIQAALKRGNTFYFYALADNKNELDVVLSYSSRRKNKSLEPNLYLVYSFITLLDEIKLFEKAVEAKILPH